MLDKTPNQSSKCKIKNWIEITDTKLYVPIVTLSTQDIARLLEHLKSG